MPTTRSRLLAGAIAAATIVAATPALAQPLFWSTQAQPIEETQAMREQVLAGFPGGVTYQAENPSTPRAHVDSVVSRARRLLPDAGAPKFTAHVAAPLSYR
jgi:hypothetical protein